MNIDRRVAEIMSKNIIGVQQEDRIGKILEIFKLAEVHHILVLDQGTLAGVISKSDILTLFENRHVKNDTSDFSKIVAKDVMSANPLTIESEDTVGLAADIILSNKMHSLPVVDDGELIGILTSHDLLKHAYNM